MYLYMYMYMYTRLYMYMYTYSRMLKVVGSSPTHENRECEQVVTERLWSLMA